MSKESELLDACAIGKLSDISRLLDDGVDVSYQDPKDGMSALMKAADGSHLEAVEMLLSAGCPWNLQDHEGYTAGEYGMHDAAILERLVDWGVQAELVLGNVENQPAGGSGVLPSALPSASQQQQQVQRGAPLSSLSSASVQRGATLSSLSSAEGASTSGDASQAYLSQKLHYSEDGTKLLDADGEAVMMGWEAPLMIRHAELICRGEGKDVMNVGFGLGLVDKAIQAHSPRSHIIIEAHPDVYNHALSLGWGTKPGVRLIKGRWQQVIPQLLDEGVKLDGVFWDTYAEYYSDMREFHDMLPLLLRNQGVYSFFNGLAPDNIFFHMVYSRLVKVELSKLGFKTSYLPVNIQEALEPSVWEGVKNKYWHFKTYFLPECCLEPS